MPSYNFVKRSFNTITMKLIVAILTMMFLSKNGDNFVPSCTCEYIKYLGQVVESIVSLTSLFRGHLVKCFTIL